MTYNRAQWSRHVLRLSSTTRTHWECRWSADARSRPNPNRRPVPAGGLDVNAVVSYNVKAIRERRGWTQQSVAERLGRLTGHQLPQASISAMERGFDGDRRRRFDAHELYLLSIVFDVPIAYFFIPPPGSGAELLADTARPVAELYAVPARHRASTRAARRTTSRDPHQQPRRDRPRARRRVRQRRAGARNWHQHFRTWRKKRLREVEREYGDRLDEVADFLGEFATKIEALGPAATSIDVPPRGEEVLSDDEQAPTDEELLAHLEQAQERRKA